MNKDTTKAREDARRTNGKFGAQERSEAGIGLDTSNIPTTVKRVMELEVGDRIMEKGALGVGEVITRIHHHEDYAQIWTDGSTSPHGDIKPNSHADFIVADSDHVDFSDPDAYENEVARIVDAELDMHLPAYLVEIHRGTGAGATPENYEAIDISRDRLERDVRARVHRASQPSSISSLAAETLDPTKANGRAKVGDNVTFTSPMFGDAAYEVVGKARAKVVAGVDADGEIRWAESNEMEYVIKDLSTGKTTTSDLRQAGWRRIPAPGDNGPAARRMVR
jgi:hypothetical protein